MTDRINQAVRTLEDRVNQLASVVAEWSYMGAVSRFDTEGQRRRALRQIRTKEKAVARATNHLNRIVQWELNK